MNRDRSSGWLAACGVGGAILVSCVGLIFDSGFDDDTTVEMPTDRDRREITAQLARATERQGICYGWSLADDGSAGARGSNLGPDEPVTDNPVRCPRWVEVRATVSYAPASSRFGIDKAAVDVAASPDIDAVDWIERGIFLLYLDEQAFIDDPARSIGRAALALPLLVAEWGNADAMAVAEPAVRAPDPLEDVGREFWLEGPFFGVAAPVLLAAAMGFLFLGWRARRAWDGSPRPYDRPVRIGGIRRSKPVRASASAGRLLRRRPRRRKGGRR
jgi:hypothetical protein